MARINGNALTDKGVVKTQVRNGVAEKETKAFLNNNLKEYEKVQDKNIFVKEYESTNGTVYATWTLTVSNKHPQELAPKKKATKKVETETFEIEE